MSKIWGKNGIICVETRTCVGMSFFGRRGRYDIERCKVEPSQWFIGRVYRFIFYCEYST